MSPRSRRLLALVVLAVAVVAIVVAVSGTLLGTRQQTATGVVVRVDTVSLTDVRGFDLREADGTVLHFEIGKLDINPPAFNPQHLSAHAATAEPVRVTYEDDAGRLVAVRLEDGD